MIFIYLAAMIAVWLLAPVGWALDMSDPQLEQLLTSQIYHEEPQHLAINAVTIGVFGWDYERRHGGLLLLMMIFAAGVLACVCEYLWDPGYTGRIFGASGAAAALVGVYVRDKVTALIASPVILSFFWGAWQADPGVAHGAHIGGALVGLLAAAVSLMAAQEEPKEQGSPS